MMIQHIDFILALVRIPELLGRGKFSFDQIKADRCDDWLFHRFRIRVHRLISGFPEPTPNLISICPRN